MKGPYKLKLEKLRFLSAVDMPAQGEGARAMLLKRDTDGVTMTAAVAKLNDELGLVFGYAFSSSLDGGRTPHIDYQDDAIDPDFLKCAMDFVAGGGATDVNHDERQDGRVIFAWPLLPEINKALGIEANRVGLAVAIKPSAETYKRFKTGELTGFSIFGTGFREEMEPSKGVRSEKRFALGPDLSERYVETDEQIVCTNIGTQSYARKAVHYDAGARGTICKATWSTATIDDLPDSSFLYIEAGGTKDKDGKTTPRSLRHFPYRDADGKVDIDHLRDAIGRIPQSSLPATLRNKLQVKAEKLLAKEHSKGMAPTGKCTAGHDMAIDKKTCPDCGAKMAYKSVRKQVVLTSVTDGHQHAIDLDDPADYCGDRLSTTYATSEGAEFSHAHVWTFDPTSGAVTIAMDSGHDHSVADVVPPTVLAAFRLSEQAEAAQDAQQLLEQVLDGGASAGEVTVTIAARNSTPNDHVKHADLASKENTAMPDAKDTQIADLTKRAERAERIAKMSGAHKTHFDTLTGDDAEAFLAKSVADRDAIIADVAKRASEATAIVYTSKTTGAVFRKSDDPRLVDMAKREDEREEKIEKAEIEALRKSHLGNLAGEDGAHDFVITACREHAKRLGDAGKPLLDKALTAMKGWNALGAAAAKAKGINPGNEPGLVTKSQAMAALTAGLTEYAKKNNLSMKTLWTEALPSFVATPEGEALQRAVDTATAEIQS